MSACFCHGSEGQSRPTAEMRGATVRRLVTSGGAVFFTLSVFAAPNAAAETLLWTGSGGEDWSTASNWALSRRVPDTGDNVFVDSFGPAITIGTSAEANEVSIGVSIGGDGTLVVLGALETKSFYLGVADGSSGAATFSGATWKNDDDKIVSVDGSGTGVLVLSHGTTASSGTVKIGGIGTGNGSLTLDNSSSLTSSDTVSVGFGSGSSSGSGGAGSLNVLAGSKLDSVRGVVAEDEDTTGTAIVSGQGSRWTTSGEMVVGDAGVGTLTITGGGTVISQTTTLIANLESADGSAVTVSRLGSSLQSRDTLMVGNGGAATLLVEAAGSVDSGNAVIGRHSVSSATVTGNGSNWKTGDLQIGGDTSDPSGTAGNGRLNIAAGGTVQTTAAQLGAVAGATGAAVVDGQGSAWTVGSGDLDIGAKGAGSLAITGGGLIDARNIVLATNAGSSGSVRVSGADSTLRSGGGLTVGRGGNGALVVEAGGTVESNNSVVAALSGSSSSVTITGDGSSWKVTGTLIAGYQNTSSADVTVSAGGDIRAGQMMLGDLAGSSGTMTITGAGSNVTAYVDRGLGTSGRLTVGQSGSGDLTVTNGASLDAYQLYVGSSAGSDGTVFVSGAGSRASVSDMLVIGAAGSGSVEVTGGAAFAAPTIVIASAAGSTGVLNIGAAAAQTARSAGAVDARTISFGAGNGRIVFNHSETAYLLAADISGAGSVVAQKGITRLSGNNSYSGGTTISGGTLQGTARSFGAGDIANNARLVVDGAGTFSNVMNGNGSFEKTGEGNLVLTADSTYSRPTAVSAGKLSVNGSLASVVSVAGGATLGGSGTIGGLMVGSRGTLAPGNSIGTLTSTGNATFASGSTYAFEIDANGNSDRLAVTGTITIDNDVNLVVTLLTNHSAFSLKTRYSILSATGGVTGTFSNIDENFAYLTAGVTKSADGGVTYLSFSPASMGAGFLTASTSTANARAAANAVEALAESAPLYEAAVFLQQGETQSAFSQLAGEIHPSLAMALINRSGQTRDVILNRLRSAFEGVDARPILPVAYAEGGQNPLAFDEGALTFWSSVFGSRGRIDSDGNGSSADMRGGGVLFGLDGELSDGWRAGVAAGYGHDDINQTALVASADVDSYYLATYAGTTIGPASLRLGAIHAFQDAETRRSISFSTLEESLSASYGGSTSQVFAEAAWRFDFDLTHIEPYANIAYVNTRTDGFREKGGIGAVSAGSVRYDQLYTTLGARITRDIALEGMLGRAMFDLAWRHNYGDAAVGSSLFYEGGGAFSVASTSSPRDAAILNLGLSYDLTPSATLTFRYGAVFGAGVLDQSAAAELGVRF
ncbi:autotransporter outer membrane beta-barrel domain-containing protein [Agrobacterium tumefaciens]|uniref:autotransporter outer membrane beta-barrel domain-containing protein n=1 Tax=Agrobacterium tumefaciens TaxID=358 RepID=UPI001573C45B|nr:autotransporter domain-containing protein [Agrobacterium tumefaciens]WCK04095.1 autotransporter domain-containing protein [Agrobacterium tumefaciens]